MPQLIDVLPKDANGQIVLLAAGEISGEIVGGMSDPSWLTTNFAALSAASTPLSSTDFASLQAIGPYWAQSADTWRAQGLI